MKQKIERLRGRMARWSVLCIIPCLLWILQSDWSVWGPLFYLLDLWWWNFVTWLVRF